MTKPTPEEFARDALLAAPDSMLNSEVERTKYTVRKAREKAKEEQLRSRKRTNDPTTEDLLLDLIRVAEDPVTNSLGFRFSTLSRKRYREFGHYHIDIVDTQFGQFTRALEVAGLRDEAGTRAKKAARAQHTRVEHAARYVQRHVRPYVLDPSERGLTGTELILSISDTHATFLDPFTWYSFLYACLVLKPDIIIFNGDILEGAEISRFPKIPGWSVSLQLEFDFAREMFAQTRRVAPDADIWWGAGNHGLDRLAMYLTQVAPAFAALRTLKFDKLAGLDDYNVRLAMGGTISSPENTEDDPQGILLHGFYRVYHGRKLGVTPALAELREAGRSGQSGHVHRAQLIYGTTEQLQGFSWMSTPMGCAHRAGRAYMKGVTTGWQKGFGIAFLSPGEKVHQYPVVTEGGSAFFEGHHLTDPGFPEPDPQKLWLKDFNPPT